MKGETTTSDLRTFRHRTNLSIADTGNESMSIGFKLPCPQRRRTSKCWKLLKKWWARRDFRTRTSRV